MSTTLTNGLKLPDKGSVDWYADMQNNYSILDGAVGTVAEHTSALSGKAPLVHTHTKSDITDFPAYGTTADTICEGNDSRLSDARTPVAHTHTKSDVTDLFNSANVWSGENTFSVPCKTLGKKLLTDITDLDDAYYNGEFCGFNPNTLHNPTGSYGNVLTINNAVNVPDNTYTSWVTQIATAANDAYLGVRKRANGGAWTSWTKILTESHAIPTVTNTYDLGSSSYQWNNLYAKNYYYNGTAWGLDKVNTWSAQQKIVGSNSRGTISIYNPAYTKGGTLSVTDLSIGSIYMGDGGQTGLANSLTFISTDLAANGAKTLLSLSAMENTALSGMRTNVVIQYDKNDVDNPKKMSVGGALIPNPDATFPLGTPSFRWKTLNGINPGALSLPDTSVFQSISTSGLLVDGSTQNVPNTQNLFDNGVALQNGWLQIRIPEGSNNWVLLSSDSRINHVGLIATAISKALTTTVTQGLNVYVPVTKGCVPTFIIQMPINTNISMTFFPCFGNV